MRTGLFEATAPNGSRSSPLSTTTTEWTRRRPSTPTFPQLCAKRWSTSPGGTRSSRGTRHAAPVEAVRAHEPGERARGSPSRTRVEDAGRSARGRPTPGDREQRQLQQDERVDSLGVVERQLGGNRRAAGVSHHVGAPPHPRWSSSAAASGGVAQCSPAAGSACCRPRGDPTPRPGEITSSQASAP